MRLIDADALIDSLGVNDDEDVYCRSVIADAPTIEPERTGKWITVNNGKWNVLDVLKCSACGEIDNRMYRTDRYCPNCGARMES